MKYFLHLKNFKGHARRILHAEKNLPQKGKGASATNIATAGLTCNSHTIDGPATFGQAVTRPSCLQGIAQYLSYFPGYLFQIVGFLDETAASPGKNFLGLTVQAEAAGQQHFDLRINGF